MENNNEANILFSKKQVAEILNVSTKTISRLIAKGELPIIQIGRNIRIKKSDVFEFVERQNRYNLGCVGTTCASTGEKPCQSLNVVTEKAESTTSMSDTSLEKRLNDLREHVTSG